MINNLEVLDPVLAIHYPDFHNNNHNLFRTYLTKETFLAIKNLKTPKYNNSLRSIIQGGLEYQSNKIGCFSCDPECYETFNLLFYPILQEINQGINIKGFKYVKDYGFKFLQDSKLTQEHQFVKSFKLKIRRNVEGFAFNMTLNKEIREKLRENLVCAVQNINYFDFSQDLGSI